MKTHSLGKPGIRQTWSFAIGKFLTDPVWWVWLFWLPPFLNAKFGLDITQIGPPLIVIYIVADIGSIGGGWLSSTFIKRGWSVNFGRKISMLICAVCVIPVVFATFLVAMFLVMCILPGSVGLAPRYREKVHRCLDTFARMLSEHQFDTDDPMTGLEVELNLVDELGDPALKNAEALAAIADPDFQTELGQFNLEINVPPEQLARAAWRRSRTTCAPASTTPRRSPPRSAPTW